MLELWPAELLEGVADDDAHQHHWQPAGRGPGELTRGQPPAALLEHACCCL